jgi:hypothetical protein
VEIADITRIRNREDDIFCRLILSESEPNTFTNGIPIAIAITITIVAVRGFTFRMLCI